MAEYKYTSNDECIITIEEQEEIVNWLRENYLRLKKNGSNRYMKSLDEIPDIPKIVWDIKKRIVDKENMHEQIQEPFFRDSIGYMFDGAQLHEHTDPNQGDLIHTRFNVYVQLPEEGGYPVYAGKTLKLKERTYICCKSGIDLHYCEKCIGKRERVVLSYGFLLPNDRIKNIVYEYD
jgi:CRISPR/Cas system-associated protein Cas5 (RAMP superfamily)